MHILLAEDEPNTSQLLERKLGIEFGNYCIHLANNGLTFKTFFDDYVESTDLVILDCKIAENPGKGYLGYYGLTLKNICLQHSQFKGNVILFTDLSRDTVKSHLNKRVYHVQKGQNGYIELITLIKKILST